MPSAMAQENDMWLAIKQVRAVVMLLFNLCKLLTSPQISQSTSDSDYIEQLVPVMKDPRYNNQLIQAFDAFSNERESEIEKICNANHQEFVSSVNQLLQVRQNTGDMTDEILELNASIQESIDKLAEQKKALVDSRGVRQNLNEASEALTACLEVLRLANQVYDLLKDKNYYAALRSLDELQTIHLRGISRYKIADWIDKSVPTVREQIRDAVKADLSTWLYRIRETSQYLGEVSFFYTDVRRTRNQERSEADPRFAKSKLNSALELVADETDEFDVLNNEEANIETDFTPLFEAMHIYDTLGKREQFKAEYANDRKDQCRLLVERRGLNLLDEECGDLSSLLESIAGFSIIEKATMAKTTNLRLQTDVDELWDYMCKEAIDLISKALPTVDNDELLLKIKGRIALFMLTMEVCTRNYLLINAY